VFRITVNGVSHEVNEGASLLSALRSAGVDIPSLCHDPRTKAYGGCRLCVVHVEGAHVP
jgi:formate dehydrogenase major subunit